jgi:hypothetical protein
MGHSSKHIGLDCLKWRFADGQSGIAECLRSGGGSPKFHGCGTASHTSFSSQQTHRWREQDSNPRSLSEGEFWKGPGEGMRPEVRFAADSSLEGDGFEPWVPNRSAPVFERVSHDGLTASRPGTGSSNPSPSSGESTANRTFIDHGCADAARL